jgi:small subunit ribosomal protein S6e
MVEFKVIINSPKEGKSIQQVIPDENTAAFMGKKIHDKIQGDSFGMTGYEFEITGGSDSAGKPMRSDIEGTGRKSILAVSGVGVKKKRKGMRKRKTLAGNTIFENTAQINLKVIKKGKKDLFEEKKEEKTEESKEPEDKKAEDKPGEEKKE